MKITKEFFSNLLIHQILMLAIIVFSGCEKKEDKVTDIDGNVYRTINIGTQTWMVENLKTTRYRNGDPIPNVTDLKQWENITTGAYAWYENDNSNKDPHGALYNWFAVNDNRHIAPEGWHIPTTDDCIELINYLGGKDLAGGKLKETGYIYWDSPNTGATNETGFTALGSGYASGYMGGGHFSLIKIWFGFWSSTEYNNIAADRLSLDYSNSRANLDQGFKINGMSVRCIKDN